MGQCRTKDVGELDPRFAIGGTARLEIAPPSGVIKYLKFKISGDHTTNITTGQTDGQVNIFSNFQVTFPRLGLPPVIWDFLPRDMIHFSAFLQGQRPVNANPTATTAAHHDSWIMPLSLPRHLTRNPEIWGLDTRELAGPIIVEATYAAATSIGTGATAITNRTLVTVCTESRTPITPSLVLAGVQQRVTHDTDGRNGPTTIGVGNLEALWGLFIRHNDNSDQADQRQDGLITRHIIDHSRDGILSDEHFIITKARTGEFFSFAAADLPSGIAFPIFAPTGDLRDMPVMVGGQTLKVIHDSAEVLLDEVTDITVAAGDSIYYNPVGIQLTSAAVRRLRRRPAVRR